MAERILPQVAASLAIALLATWGALALWMRLPFGAVGNGVGAALWAGLMVLACWLSWQRSVWQGLAVTAAGFAGLMLWWASLLPSNDRIWQPDMARVAAADVAGDMLTVRNVRHFRWQAGVPPVEHWETRRYRLSELQGADLFLSYWSGELVAHAIVSFTFADSDPLAFSIEIRREKGEQFSSLDGFFKSYELAIIAADERDVVKVRSTVRGEDVRLYRLDMQRATARALLLEYVSLANDVSANPRWYHTLTANCTTVIFGMARRLDPGIRPDWRILLPGKLPSYLQEQDFLRRDVPLEELVRRGKIGARAQGPYPDSGFSKRIRDGVPMP